jgi:hypothetical protein
MIDWWLFPLLCTIGAAFLLAVMQRDCSRPCRAFVMTAVLFVLTPILALMWLFCFLLSLAYP